MEQGGILTLMAAMLLGTVGARDREVCTGSDMKLTVPSSQQTHYEILKMLYTGCEVVQGNLEITYLHGNWNLSFLQGISEVQGYVLIAYTSVRFIPLENLRIIRGTQLFEGTFALAVLNNSDPQGTKGLEEVRMPNLSEILLGAVKISGNTHLCYLETIKWNDTLDQSNKFLSNILVDQAGRRVQCPPCSANCDGSCWAEGKEYCQDITHLHCAAGCQRCKGPQPNDCCHKQCAAGCTGPKDTDCLACRHFNDSGTCKDSCPALTVYNSITFQSDPNPNRKYSFGATCVKECPYTYLATAVGSCTLSCPPDNIEVVDNKERKCDKCDGPCPKVCYGLGMGSLKGERSVNSANIHQFVNCTKIFGSLAFFPETFTGDAAANISALNPQNLTVFRTLTEITGFLYIQAWPANLTDLGVFGNLTVIWGRMLYRGVFALGIESLQIESLGLRSLKEVNGGLVLIHQNPNLCYTPTITWETIFKNRQPAVIDMDNKQPRQCEMEGRMCHSLCNGSCWGPGPSQCLFCDGFLRELECVESCDVYRELVNGTRCISCDPECLPQNGSATCTGPGPDQCVECLHFQDGVFCVEKCQRGPKIWKYADKNKECQMCETNCTHSCTNFDDKGCPLDQMPGPGTSIAAAVGGVLLFLILLGLLVSYWSHKKRKAERRNKQENELVEPLTPSGATPNQAKMRILKETELKKFRVLGSGAFGTVFKGVWAPEGENVRIPVAIKVLRENTSPKANKEILDEAYVMAGVSHPHVCRLLGICLTSTVQLITQLMPYGCLLDYVREKKDQIGSRYLLSWCRQIAEGMRYLENVRLVHRDLAARNVLVKNANNVKITDFGLARLLDIYETEYHAEGGKVPIKWMALESIIERRFTHQSDVWSYGVTVWELMTFGAKPYDDHPARDIPELLEKGERLSQPPICTEHIYGVMTNCWMIDPDSRPRFQELVAEFTEMAKEPSKYVIIQNDECMNLLTPDGSEFFRTFLEEEDGMDELLDAEEYLVPQPAFFNATSEQVPNGRARISSNRSMDQSLNGDMNPGGRSALPSVTTIGRGQYPTLPLPGRGQYPSVKSGGWSQMASLARSTSQRSAAGYSDSVFLEGDAMAGQFSLVPSCREDSTTHRYYDDPSIDPELENEDDIEVDGYISPEYVNQTNDGFLGGMFKQSLKPLLPRQTGSVPRYSSIKEGMPGFTTTVENPEYLTPSSHRDPGGSSPAFDNLYYWDMDTQSRSALEKAIPSQINGFVTPAVENPEYLGLSESWSGNRAKEH
ncbi:receptor tyrosine-protein kinase erbB-2 [Erpetoichthys calabaricus]|uniref:Receptor protein-tyrosine kinase n=1 Tax=Erpetoichthys calabaricus TaxID=27687 RepID=A0A8C4SYZ1_ERPCA|nr:receptor tyrosine-protein kinase erbB-2 [Erpetoichthys calabaricus]